MGLTPLHLHQQHLKHELTMASALPSGLFASLPAQAMTAVLLASITGRESEMEEEDDLITGTTARRVSATLALLGYKLPTVSTWKYVSIVSTWKYVSVICITHGSLGCAHSNQ